MATNGVNGHSDGTASVKDFVSQDYDYVIIGGGTAGLCVVSNEAIVDLSRHVLILVPVECRPHGYLRTKTSRLESLKLEQIEWTIPRFILRRYIQP